jgi:hypothetical protein
MPVFYGEAILGQAVYDFVFRTLLFSVNTHSLITATSQ